MLCLYTVINTKYIHIWNATILLRTPSIPLSLVLRTFPRQRRIVGVVVLYADCVVSKKSRWLVLRRSSCSFVLWEHQNVKLRVSKVSLWTASSHEVLLLHKLWSARNLRTISRFLKLHHQNPFVTEGTKRKTKSHGRLHVGLLRHN
jgi:hypothetical protein